MRGLIEYANNPLSRIIKNKMYDIGKLNVTLFKLPIKVLNESATDEP